MRKLLAAVLVLTSGAAAQAADGFEAVRCGADVRTALLGKRSANDRVVAIEARHKDIGLKDLGASEISDNLTSISWRICEKEYVVLEDKRSIVRDVIEFPAHSKAAPAFEGACQINGKESSDIIVAVLDNSTAGKMLPAKAAWKIDVKRAKFVALPTNDLMCPRDGILTVDGGL